MSKQSNSERPQPRSVRKDKTICAVATPPGRGGISVIRISGDLAPEICEAIIGFLPEKRYAQRANFYNPDTQDLIDEGIVIYYPKPHSFTGEDVVEFQGHGGAVVSDQLLKSCLEQGAQIAEPGEFSLRAFLNNKMDLVQAEAIADLINASSAQAARSAMRSLHGEFSKLIEKMVAELIRLRVFIEAAIDFPEEEIDFIEEHNILEQIVTLLTRLSSIQQQARCGQLLQEGISLVIAGKPNAGKSSLLNVFSGEESAIVTDIPGTTRDVIRQQINLDGIPIHLIDTAGIRDDADVIEQVGIERAWQEIHKADQVLLVVDARDFSIENATQSWSEFFNDEALLEKMIIVRNKIDLLGEEPTQQLISIPKVMSTPEIEETHFPKPISILSISIKQRLGISLLSEYIKKQIGYDRSIEGSFIARRRHLHALTIANTHLQQAKIILESSRLGELVAEECRLAQLSLSQITGEFHSDDLLGEIFSNFCIGK